MEDWCKLINNDSINIIKGRHEKNDETREMLRQLPKRRPQKLMMDGMF